MQQLTEGDSNTEASIANTNETRDASANNVIVADNPKKLTRTLSWVLVEKNNTNTTHNRIFNFTSLPQRYNPFNLPDFNNPHHVCGNEVVIRQPDNAENSNHQLNWIANILAIPGGKEYLEGDTYAMLGRFDLGLPYYTKSAELKFPPAYIELRQHYFYMKNIKKSEEAEKLLTESMKWFGQQNFYGNPIASYGLAIMARIDSDDENESVKSAFRHFMNAAQQKYPPGIYALGECYQYGIGTPVDLDLAFKMFLDAAERGSANAMCKVGEFYEHGKSVKQDRREAFKWYQRAADLRFDPSFYHLGRCYENGIGVDINKIKAGELFQIAAFMGNQLSKVRLSYSVITRPVCAETCIGLYGKALFELQSSTLKGSMPSDENNDDNLRFKKLIEISGAKYFLEGETYFQINQYLSSIKLYKKSAEMNFPPAYFKLACLYHEYIHLKDAENQQEWRLRLNEYIHWIRRVANTLEWFTAQANNHNPIAEYTLGLMLCYGFGVEIDLNRGSEYILRAALHGYAAAQCKIAIACIENGADDTAYKQGFHWALKAANKGHSLAQFYVAECYQTGKGTVKHNQNALEFYQKAAKVNCHLALFRLGQIYEKGLAGVRSNESKAVSFFQKAADLDNEEALSKLGIAYENATLGLRANPERAVEFHRRAAAFGNSKSYKQLGKAHQWGIGAKQNNMAAIFFYTAALSQGEESVAEELLKLKQILREKGFFSSDSSQELADFFAAIDAPCFKFGQLGEAQNIFSNINSMLVKGISVEVPANIEAFIIKKLSTNEKRDYQLLLELNNCLIQANNVQNCRLLNDGHYSVFSRIFMEASSKENAIVLHKTLISIFIASGEGRASILQAIKFNEIDSQYFTMYGYDPETLQEYINLLFDKKVQENLDRFRKYM